MQPQHFSVSWSILSREMFGLRIPSRFHFLSSTDALVMVVKSPMMASFSSIGVHALACPLGQGKFAAESDKVELAKTFNNAIEESLQKPVSTVTPSAALRSAALKTHGVAAWHLEPLPRDWTLCPWCVVRGGKEALN